MPVLAGKGVAVDDLIFVPVVSWEAEEAKDVDFAPVIVVDVGVVALDFTEVEVIEFVRSDVVVKIEVFWLVLIAEDGVRTGCTTT